MDRFASEQELQDYIALKVFDGDESALTDILEHYGPRLEKWLLKAFPGALRVEDAEEIISDAVRRFWSYRKKYSDTKASIRCLLHVIARRRALDVLSQGWQRARGLEVDVEKDFMDWQYMENRHVGAPNPPDEKTPESQERLRLAVRETMAELPELQRKILEHDALAEDEVDASELGRRLGGIPGGTIRTNRSRGKDAFRKGMKKRGYDCQ